MTSFLAVPGFALAKLGEILLTPFGFPTVKAEKLALFWVSVVAAAVSVMFSISLISVTATADSLLRFAAPKFNTAAWSAAVLFTCAVARTWVPPSLDICVHHSATGPQHTENTVFHWEIEKILLLWFYPFIPPIDKRKNLFISNSASHKTHEQLAIYAHARYITRRSPRAYRAFLIIIISFVFFTKKQDKIF